MDRPRQRQIPVTRQERERLDEHKQRYEQATGDHGDWGRFLGIVTLAGLAALGIYGLARATRRSTDSVTVSCPSCAENFALALPQPEPRVVEAICPRCNAEIVVDVGTWEVSLRGGQQPFAEWAGICPSCGTPEVVKFVTRPPYWREQVKVVCRQCGEEFTMHG
jgi:hypothetical protein